MKKMLLIAIITMLATMGLFAVDPATATFDITAVKDYVSSDVEWTPSFSYEELYGTAQWITGPFPCELHHERLQTSGDDDCHNRTLHQREC